MTAQIIYGVVFGIPRVEKTQEPSVTSPFVQPDHFSDDVYYMSPPLQLPCDSEAE